MTPLITIAPSPPLRSIRPVKAFVAQRRRISAMDENHGPLKVARILREGLQLVNGRRRELARLPRITEVSAGTPAGSHGGPSFVMVLRLAFGRVLVRTEKHEAWQLSVTRLKTLCRAPGRLSVGRLPCHSG